MGTRKSPQAEGASTPRGRRTLTAARAVEPATVVSLTERAIAPRAPRVLAAAHAPRRAAPAAPASTHSPHAAPPPPPIALFPARAAFAVSTVPAAHQPRRQRFGDLRDALAEGWEIVQPIFARPLWSAPDDSKTAFNFVLAGPRGMRLVTVPEGRTVERFIRARQLAVDYAR